jgi:O-antigen ligase
VATTTEPLRLRSATWGRLGNAAFIAAALFAEAVLAAGIVSQRLLPLLLLALGALATAAILRAPMAGAALVLVLTTSALHPRVVDLQLGPLTLRPYELALGAMLAAALAVPRRKTWGGAAGAGLAAFLLIVTASSFAAVAAGDVVFADAFNWSRPFAVLLFFYVVIRLFPEREEHERLLAIAAGVAAVTGLVAVAMAVQVSLPGPLGEAAAAYADQAFGNLRRVRLPGVALAYALVWWSVLRLARTTGTARLGWALAVAGITLNLALSFNRNMWVGAAIGLVLLLLFGGAAWRGRLSVGLAIAVAAVSAIALVGLQVDESSPVAPFVERGRTLLDPREVQREDSLQDRFGENDRAWEAIREHPLTGIGAGVHFGQYYNQQEEGTWRRREQLFLHNQYVYLLLVGGIPALVAFVVFLGGVVVRARRSLTEAGVAALAAGVLMIAVSAFVMISFAEANMALALALVAGALVARADTAT